MPRPKVPVRTQSLLFTIYGDYVYIRNKGSEIWIGSLIKLLAEFGFSEQAARLALSRMCRKGWLRRQKVGNRSYYSMTSNSVRLMDESVKRIFPAYRRNKSWDHQWHLVTYSVPEKRRSVRERLRKELTWLGYGALSYGTWISPYNSRQEIERIVAELKIEDLVEIFTAQHEGFASNGQLVARCWNLEAINQRYQEFLDKYELAYDEFTANLNQNMPINNRDCFVDRVMLSHEYRKFPFIDPGLPWELLPKDWLGERAELLFENCRNALGLQAESFFDSIYEDRRSKQ